MISEQRIDGAIAALFDSIQFPSEPSGLYDPLRYMIAVGGKRIRPKLCMLAYSLFKDDLGEEIFEPAAALEVFHTFTLIHDDIMDKSPMRRGQETVWKKWNDDTAILSGDVMLIDSYRRISSVPQQVRAEVMDLFTMTAAQVCEGQQYDMDFESVPEVTMADYMKMIGLKTGVLIACSAKVGALMGGASMADADALYEYGYQLGLAFQVADDYLDAYGDAKVFGKPIGGDIINDKKSWMLTRLQEKIQDPSPLAAAMAMPVGTLEEQNDKIEAVRALYDAHCIGEDARQEVCRLTALALDAAKGLKLGAVRMESLRRFADSLVGRAK